MISGGGRLAAVGRGVAVVVLAAAVSAAAVGLWLTWPDQRPGPAAAPTAEVTTSTPSVDAETLVPASQDVPERIDTAWEDRVSARSGIGVVAVRAYGTAVLRLSREQPRCKLGWTTLAGIGAVESGHGTEKGSALRRDGSTTRPIIGPALAGTGGHGAIASDPAFQRFHGDPTWDHAVGPMQFIGSTWARWGSDGNDDGVKDPRNIFDAAYAAGRYLCASGNDLTQGSAWGEAIFSYNHSPDYVASVYYRAREYAAAG